MANVHDFVDENVGEPGHLVSVLGNAFGGAGHDEPALLVPSLTHDSDQ